MIIRDDSKYTTSGAHSLDVKSRRESRSGVTQVGGNPDCPFMSLQVRHLQQRNFPSGTYFTRLQVLSKI